jgi:hypothetical protein
MRVIPAWYLTKDEGIAARKPAKPGPGLFRFALTRFGNERASSFFVSPPCARHYFPSASPPAPRGPLIGSRTRNRVSPGFDFNSIAP